MNTEISRQHFREALFQTLASEGHAKDDCAHFTERFDKLTDGGLSGENAAQIIFSAYGSGDKNKITTIKQWIEKELEFLNTTQKMPNLSAKQRLAKVIETLSKNIDKVSIVFNGQELSRAEIDRIKPRLPGCLREPTTYTATASTKGKKATMILDVSE